MSSKIHGKQIKDNSILLNKINPVTGQILTLSGTSKIQQNAVPTSATDLTNKQYVDSVAAGFDPKASVRVATTGNISLSSAPASIDSVSLSIGDRVLVWQQSVNTENGIYDFNGAGSAMTRSSDMDGSPTTDISTGNNTFVTEGSTYQGNGYVVIGSGTWSGTLAVGVAPIIWTQFSGAGSFIWGDGISNVGNSIYVDISGNSGLTFSSNKLTVDSNIAGNGLSFLSGVLNVNVGSGLTINSDNVLVDYSTVALVMGGAGLTASGNTLGIGSGNTGILVTSDAIGLSMSATTDSSLSLASDGLKLNLTTLATNLEGTGLTSSSGKLNVVTGTGITISGDAITTNASLINTTTYLNITNVATGSSIQSALSAIDTALSSFGSSVETVSVTTNPTGTFLSSISTPVVINTGITYSRLSSGEVFVFVNGINYPVGNSGTASDFFFAATTSYSGSLTASSAIYSGYYLWSTVSALGFDLDTTDEILVKYNAY